MLDLLVSARSHGQCLISWSIVYPMVNAISHGQYYISWSLLNLLMTSMVNARSLSDMGNTGYWRYFWSEEGTSNCSNNLHGQYWHVSASSMINSRSTRRHIPGVCSQFKIIWANYCIAGLLEAFFSPNRLAKIIILFRATPKPSIISRWVQYYI